MALTPQFALVAAYSRWKSTISVKKRARAFVESSVNRASQWPVKGHFLNYLFARIGSSLNRRDGCPFNLNGHSISKPKSTLVCQQTIVSMVVGAMCVLESIDPIHGDWLQTASSAQVRIKTVRAAIVTKSVFQCIIGAERVVRCQIGRLFCCTSWTAAVKRSGSDYDNTPIVDIPAVLPREIRSNPFKQR
jgi:hypothetical protein